jgi:hypothetical protein
MCPEPQAGSQTLISSTDATRRKSSQEVGSEEEEESRLGSDVIIHLLNQARGGAVEHPQPAQRVLDQVAHDPVRGEELRGSRDVFRFDFLTALFSAAKTSSLRSEM